MRCFVSDVVALGCDALSWVVVGGIMLGARYIVLLAFSATKAVVIVADEINSNEACFVGLVMSVECEDSLISHKGW